MNKLANAFAKAGLCTTQDAEVTGLSLKQLTALRNKAIVASLAIQSSEYKRGKNGYLRSTSDEQAELLAISKAIRKLRK